MGLLRNLLGSVDVDTAKEYAQLNSGGNLTDDQRDRLQQLDEKLPAAARREAERRFGR